MHGQLILEEITETLDIEKGRAIRGAGVWFFHYPRESSKNRVRALTVKQTS